MIELEVENFENAVEELEIQVRKRNRVIRMNNP